MQALGPDRLGPSQLDHCWSCNLGPVASPPCASVVRITRVNYGKHLEYALVCTKLSDEMAVIYYILLY